MDRLFRVFRTVARDRIVTFAVVIRVVTQRSSPLTAAHSSSVFLSLCYWEPTTCIKLLAALPIIFLVIFTAKGPGFQEMEACSFLLNLRERMQSSSEQSVVGEDYWLTTLITAAKETTNRTVSLKHFYNTCTIIILESFSFENSLMVRVVIRTSLSNSWMSK